MSVKWNKEHPECKKKWLKKRIQEYYTWLKPYKSPCVECGKSNVGFHHLFPDEKLFKISQGWGYSKNVVIVELSKCECRCPACHRREHARMKREAI